MVTIDGQPAPTELGAAKQDLVCMHPRDQDHDQRSLGLGPLNPGKTPVLSACVHPRCARTRTLPDQFIEWKKEREEGRGRSSCACGWPEAKPFPGAILLRPWIRVGMAGQAPIHMPGSWEREGRRSSVQHTYLPVDVSERTVIRKILGMPRRSRRRAGEKGAYDESNYV